MTREEAINNLKKVLGFSPTYDKAFYTLFPNGAEPSLPSDVDEAAETFAESIWKEMRYELVYDNLAECFKAGAEWHRNKMLKEAVEGVVGKDGILTLSNGEAVDLCPSLDKLALGVKSDDKVRIVVLKAEEDQK